MAVTLEIARDFLRRAKFVWYQRFPLTNGIYTPGVRDIAWTLQWCDIPSTL